jgi:hypothetical protein
MMYECHVGPTRSRQEADALPGARGRVCRAAPVAAMSLANYGTYTECEEISFWMSGSPLSM